MHDHCLAILLCIAGSCGLNAYPTTAACACYAPNILQPDGVNCCRPNAVVSGNTCVCRAGFSWSDAAQACVTNSLPSTTPCGPWAYRTPSGYCACHSPNVPVGDGINCCRPNAIWQNGACVCRPGYTWSESSQACISSAPGERL